MALVKPIKSVITAGKRNINKSSHPKDETFVVLQEIEKIEKNSKIEHKTKGGARPGCGRKKGKLSQATLEKQAVLKAFQQRVMENADQLFNAQVSLAQGANFLFKIVETKDKKTGKVTKKETVIVDNANEIKKYLDGEFNNMLDSEGNDTYYFITTKSPDNRAIDSMLDRTFGKAHQSVTVDGALTIEDAMEKSIQERAAARAKRDKQYHDTKL